jgi:glycerol kinase
MMCTVLQTREVLEAMVQDAGQSGFKLLRADGGASRNNLLMQLQADAIQVRAGQPHSIRA